MLDLAPWLSPLDGDNPSGQSLRDDPRFHEIEELIRAGTELVGDERNKPPGEQNLLVDWPRVLECAGALRTKGRDLWLLVIVARALLNEQGAEGLAQGLTLITKTIEAHWDTLHPELRQAASRRDAALRRINALQQLENDQDGVLGDLRRRAALDVRGLGPIRGRDLELASIDSRTAQNEAAGGMSERERAALVAEHEQLVARVRSALKTVADKAPGELAALTAGMRAAAEALRGLEAALTSRIRDKADQEDAGKGGAEAPQFPALNKALGRMLATIGVTASTTSPEEKAPTAPASGSGAVPDRLSTRAEVVACLDRIIEFYDRTEPASPVPYLARRMRRMVPMDFLQLMEDLAPSGLKEFRSLAGLSDDRKAPTRTQGDKT